MFRHPMVNISEGSRHWYQSTVIFTPGIVRCLLIRMQVVPGMTGSTHPQWPLANKPSWIKVNQVKVAAGLWSDIDCQFIVPDPVTPTRFLTSLMLTMPAEVEWLIRSAWSAPAKTSPPDLLSTSFLRACHSESSKIISHTANRSFAASRFPSVWNTGLVSPMLKKTGLPNFLPIIDLMAVSKIVERADHVSSSNVSHRRFD